MAKKRVAAGIDAGSRTLKVVIVDALSRRVLASETVDQRPEQAALAESLLAKLLRRCGASRANLVATVATGYGREIIEGADSVVTEITCHARGVRSLFPKARTVIDVGGQDSKVIHLDPGGTVTDFAMNERCAAGTGRFLEVVAAKLTVDLPRLSRLAAASRRPARINSTCVVFAESEIVGLLASGARPSDIAAGVLSSLASRITTLAGRRVERPVVFVGGVAMLGGMVKSLARSLGTALVVPAGPQLTGALGAALIAADSAAR
jgi:predicted CoA-substrate-specific enzyme activase